MEEAPAPKRHCSKKSPLAITTTITTTTATSFGTNDRLLSLNVLPGEHTLTVYAPACHYFESGTLNHLAATYWSEKNRSQLLGSFQQQLQSNNYSSLHDLLKSWDSIVYGTPPDFENPRMDVDVLDCSSQQVFLRPTISLPAQDFFEQDPFTIIATKNSKGCVEVPFSEIAKFKLSDFLSFNQYSYFFPQVRSSEWQRNSKLFGNRGQVTVTLHEKVTLRDFLKLNISGSFIWRGGDLWASDLVIGPHAVEWQRGKFIPAQSKFKVSAKKEKEYQETEETMEYQETEETSVGIGMWPVQHRHMRRLS